MDVCYFDVFIYLFIYVLGKTSTKYKCILLINLFIYVYNYFSCTPDRNCHTFCLGDKIASHPGVLTQAKKIRKTLK